jgi:diguanylate cyclase (GGDEF)-like protein/PAS domain S-box-containing protein
MHIGATYDLGLAGLSFGLATLAAYSSIAQARRLRWEERGAAWNLGLASAALALGTGGWAMHFVGLLSLRAAVAFDPWLTAFSLICAWAGAGGAFGLAYPARTKKYPLWIGASALTAGLLAMHWLGMSAMRLSPPATYSAWLLVAVAIAFIASSTELWLAFGAIRVSAFSIASVAGLMVLSLQLALLSARIAADARSLATTFGVERGALAGAVASGAFIALALMRCAPASPGVFPFWRMAGLMLAGEIVVILLFEALQARFGVSLWAKLFIEAGLLTLFLLPGLWRLRRYAESFANERKQTRAMLASLGEGVIAADRDGNVEYLNEAAERLTGWRSETARGAPLHEIYRATPVQRSGSGGLETRMHRKTLSRRNGARSTVEDVAATMRDERGRRTGTVVVVRDVTEHVEQEKELRLAATVFSHAVEGILITDRNNAIVRVNEAFCHITGYSAEEAIGMNPRMLASGRHHAEFFRAMWKRLKLEGEWRGEIWNRRKNGEIYPEWLSIRCICDPLGRIVNFVAVFTDISERVRNQEHIFQLAYYDNLTGLANRALLMDRMEGAIAQASRDKKAVGILFLDMDRFKLINDTLGHAMGDLLLQKVAAAIGAGVRDIDTVSRFGGDEFVVCLSDMPGDQADADEAAAAVAGKILKRLSEPFYLLGHEVVVTPSIGVAIYPWDGDAPSVLIKHADTAMYHAKSQGRDNFQLFTRDMLSIGDERLRLQSALRKALENGEFIVHYQAQVEIESGRIIGAEALLRWRNPELGMVSPAKFIPVAEDTSLIQPIGDWVLATVCRDWRNWREHLLMAGDLPRIAVNFSPRQFNQPDFVEKLLRVIKESGGEPESLEVEITEATLMRNTDTALNALKRLRANGLKVAVDDFGVGYSSLSYLKLFPIDVLKIDQSFIRDLTTNDSDAQIVRAIVAMGRSLNLTVLAEGVENEDQLAFLRREGCQEVQGYLFSKPLPAKAFAELLRRGYRTGIQPNCAQAREA